MKALTSVFIILATASACGSQYDEKQPQFNRDASAESLAQDSLKQEPVYVASSADLSSAPIAMAGTDIEALSASMEGGPSARPYSYAPAPDIQQKLDACMLGASTASLKQYDKVEVRNYQLNVTRLQRAKLAIAGSAPEIVFVKIQAEKRIARVDLSLDNPKALYCVDVEAGRVINRLQITHACQAKLGVVNIEAGVRARNISISPKCG